MRKIKLGKSDLLNWPGIFTMDEASMDNESRTLSSEAGSPRDFKIVRSKKMERSCMMCHQRKIRCDKMSPCSNCVKVDLLCCYPGPERASRRPHKTTITDVAERVARLERTIKAISSSASEVDSHERSVEVLTPPQGDANMSIASVVSTSSDELLVQDGDSGRYINEVLLSSVLEEERELQMVMGTISSDSTLPIKSPSFDIGGIFSGFNQSMKDTQRYLPTQWHAMQLWQAFVFHVNPIVKILHIPTAQATVFAAINNPQNVDEDLNALLFSIYFAAATSLTPMEVSNLLGQDKSTALNSFKQGFEQSLAASNILETPSVRSLQAFALYLRCLRAYNGGRAGWTLNGLAMRSAQSIGLHRDGKNFGLSPFQSEIRRRLWWYIYGADSRAAEDHGIALCHTEGSFDTQMPINVEDSDLYPDMKEPPTPKARWTEMSFSLVMIESSHIIKQLYRTPITAEQNRDQILSNLKSHVEEAYLQQCDPNIPIQKVTMLCARLMIAKMEFLVHQQLLNRSASKEKLSQATEESLTKACHTIEINLQLQSDDFLRGFRWFFETFTQYYALTYVLWHLSVKPFGPNTERAWAAVEGSFEIASRQDISCKLGPKWAVIELLRDKAVKARQSCGTDSIVSSVTLDNPYGVEILDGEFAYNTELAFPDGRSWDMGITDFPDWNELVGKFDMRGSIGADYSM